MIGSDDDCEDQALVFTDKCVIFGCDNAKLVRCGRYWECPHCESSYGEFAQPESISIPVGQPPTPDKTP